MDFESIALTAWPQLRSTIPETCVSAKEWLLWQSVVKACIRFHDLKRKVRHEPSFLC